MKKIELVNKLQKFLESRGYTNNADDSEALVEFLLQECDLMYCPIEIYDDISLRTIQSLEE